MTTRHPGAVAALLLIVALMLGCRSVYYSTMETFGVHKRDLLKKRVTEARDEQKAAGEQFKDALTRLKELYAFEGGNLERTYNRLKADYDKSALRAEAVRKRIRDVETVAGDLFKEWEREIKQITSESLRAGSREQMTRTRARYDELHNSLKRAEESMGPVLVKFNDHVLYLKHNLNAAAIGSLKGEATDIQAEIGKLIEDMNKSIQQADEFIKTIQ